LLATLADLPTAGPLLAATLLLAAGKHKVWTQFADLGLYNVVCVSPLLAVALAPSVASRTAGRPTGRRQSLLVRAPAVTALCVAIGAIIGCEGVAALV
jgi:cytochrome c biogenesis protein CcdA